MRLFLDNKMIYNIKNDGVQQMSKKVKKKKQRIWLNNSVPN